MLLKDAAYPDLRIRQYNGGHARSDQLFSCFASVDAFASVRREALRRAFAMDANVIKPICLFT